MWGRILNNLFILCIILVLLTSCDDSDIHKYDELLNFTSEEENITEEIVPMQPIKELPEFNRDLKELDVDEITESQYIIGAWNIKQFNEAKATNEYLIPVIIDIIDDYDVLFLQEIRDSSGSVQQKLSNINGFNYEISPKLGRSKNKEQYAYIYSSKMNPGKIRLYPDDNDVFEREPFIMEFTVNEYSFVLIGCKTKSDDTNEEIKALEEVVEWTRKEFKNDNIFIIGNLWASFPYFNKNADILTDFNWLIDNNQNTVVNGNEKTFDRIIALTDNPILFGIGVDDLDEETSGDKELLEALTENYPVFFTLQI